MKRIKYFTKLFGQKVLNVANTDTSTTVAIPNIAEDIIVELAKADPSQQSKNLQFIIRMYLKKQFLLEDVERLNNDIAKFIDVAPKLENSDLNSYQTLKEVYDAIEPYQDVQVVSTREEVRQAKEGAEYIINTKNFKALITKTLKANQYYGKGTKWCTTAESNNYFDSYSKDGDLIIIICKTEKGDRKFQFHFESGQFMDEIDQSVQTINQVDSNDKDADVNILNSYPEWDDFCQYLVEKHYKPMAELATQHSK